MMKCHRCEKRAVIRMRQHRLIFCKDHFREWLAAYTGRAIQKYHLFTPAERILLAVSGGKDSLSLWDILSRLGYNVTGVYIHLGIDEGLSYSDLSLRFTQEFARPRGLTLLTVDLKALYGSTLPEFASRNRRGRIKPCSLCGLIKRHEMNRVAQEGGFDVLATAHNLDDEVSVLFSNSLAWDLEQLARQAPLLPAREGFVRKVKPFCRVYERETAAYALTQGIAYIEDECPFSVDSAMIENKMLLNEMETRHPGLKLGFYSSFLNARKRGTFPPTLAEAEALHACPSCGQLTTSTGLCAFCRLLQQD